MPVLDPGDAFRAAREKTVLSLGATGAEVGAASGRAHG